MPITVICLDRYVPTQFTKHASTGADEKKEKKVGWKETRKEGRLEGTDKSKRNGRRGVKYSKVFVLREF